MTEEERERIEESFRRAAERRKGKPIPKVDFSKMPTFLEVITPDGIMGVEVDHASNYAPGEPVDGADGRTAGRERQRVKQNR